MRVLLIAGNQRSSDLFQEQLLPKLTLLLQDKAFTSDPANKLGLLCPGNKNQVHIESGGLIIFEVSSASSSSASVPNFTPNFIRELNGFLNEFQPDIIHTYDEGFLGLIAQYFAIRKKIPFVITLLPQNAVKKKGFIAKIIPALVKQIGMSGDFIRNFYNNATAIIGSLNAVALLKEQGLFKGVAAPQETEATTAKLLPFYTKLIRRNDQTKRYSKLVPASILITGAAILGSILTFTAIKGFSKIKRS